MSLNHPSKYPLNIEKLNEAASLFIGTHDFNAFRSSGSCSSSTVRTIYQSEWQKDGDYLKYHVAGSGFLYNMVRIMTGTMLRIGLGLADSDTVRAALDDPKRELAGDTAPAHGLTLCRVKYDLFDTDAVLKECSFDGHPSLTGA